MGLTSAKQDTDVMAEINITPFTDVLLVLLIIFMILAALAAPPGFQKELAKHAPPTPPKANNIQTHPIDVEVNAHNVVYIDGRRTSEARLYNDMATAIAYHKAHAAQGYLSHIALTADSAASYSTIIKILDAAREAGDDDVGFVTG
ncbi:MAG TPA: biopolymer transporter ExbD [Candidatus Eremiobacteraceae bacterium]|nr:biopolymer transporter ExbD [Candidatus Eremiobacteraceae bacterium]